MSYVVADGSSTSATDRVNQSGTELRDTWFASNVPALKEESFTSTIRNYLSKISFQLKSIHFPNSQPRDIMGSWESVTKSLLEREDFGRDVNKPGNWLAVEVKLIAKDAGSLKEKAKRLYDYTRDNFSATTDEGFLMEDGESLKSVFKKKSGSRLPSICSTSPC